jgi:hypothetical protein
MEDSAKGKLSASLFRDRKLQPSPYSSTFPSEWSLSGSTVNSSIVSAASRSARRPITSGDHTRTSTRDTSRTGKSSLSTSATPEIAMSDAEQSPLPKKHEEYYSSYPPSWTLPADSSAVAGPQYGTPSTYAPILPSGRTARRHVPDSPTHNPCRNGGLPSDPSFWHFRRKEPTWSVKAQEFPAMPGGMNIANEYRQAFPPHITGSMRAPLSRDNSAMRPPFGRVPPISQSMYHIRDNMGASTMRWASGFMPPPPLPAPPPLPPKPTAILDDREPSTASHAVSSANSQPFDMELGDVSHNAPNVSSQYSASCGLSIGYS